MALPRGARQRNRANTLAKGLGEKRPIVFARVSREPPKPSPKNEAAASAGPRNGGDKMEASQSIQFRHYTKQDSGSIAAELRLIAHAVRRIHDPLRANPEAVCIVKDSIARRLLALSHAVEARHA